MPDHEDSLGGETLDGEVKADAAEQSLGDGSTLGGGDTSFLSDTTDGEGENLAAGLPVIDLGKRFEIESELGKGGMGAVLLARDRSLGRQVAIKRILETKNRSSAAINRFITEAKSIATLNHNNIVQIYEFGQDDDGPLIVIEYVSGGSLLDRLKKGKLDPEEAIRITCQLCDALTFAHGKGIIHRDIKPANILMTEDGVPKLTDFGLAKQQNTDHGQTAVGTIMGTIDFMPAEQRRDSSSVDERSDLWSLAAVSYQMLTGKNPQGHRLDKLPPNIASVLGRMLEEDPAERFASAAEFKEAFLQAATAGLNASRDLGEGECPSCGTNNPSNRKWCRNAQCGESLLTTCLSCNQDTAVWDEICGECGGRQSDLRKQAAEKEAEITAALHTGDWEALLSLDPDNKEGKRLKAAAKRDAALSKAAAARKAIADNILKETLTVKIAERILASGFKDSCKYKWIELDAAAVFAKHQGDLVLSELTDLSVEVAAELAKHQGTLHLAGLMNLSAEVATALAEHQGYLDLQGVTDLSVDAAAALAKHQGELVLSGLTDLSVELAAELAKHQGDLILEGLSSLSVEVATALAKHQGNLNLWGVFNFTVDVVSVLARREGRFGPGGRMSLGFELAEAVDKHVVENVAAVTRALAMADWETVLALDPDNSAGLRMQANVEEVSATVLSRPCITNSVGMRFKEIPSGAFLMGSSDVGATISDPGYGAEQHKVTMSKGFHMQITVVTQRHWFTTMRTKPWRKWFGSLKKGIKEGDNYPATYITWQEAITFCKRLSFVEGKRYRLPTEAEWEYTCRAGSNTNWSFGNDEKVLGQYAWYSNEKHPHQVELKKPNAFGLYDMHGNVKEWCQDYYSSDYYKESPTADPQGPASNQVGGPFAVGAHHGSGHVVRGGSAENGRMKTTCSHREFCTKEKSDWYSPNSKQKNPFIANPCSPFIGFRVVLELD
jgi:formylglycine-generating enzyme required for sulfatase activity